MAKYSLRLAHLYPKLLSAYGDNGVLKILKKRCEWRDIDLIIDEIEVEDVIAENLYDMYFIDNGQGKMLNDAAQALMHQKESLKIAQENGAVIFALGGGYQLLGKYYQLESGEKLNGIDLLDIYTVESQSRHIGNITAQCNIESVGKIVGFENHADLTYIEANSLTKPLAITIVGNGNNGQDGFEGAYKKNVLGTYLQGSFLAKNPKFADYMIKTALTRKYFENIELQHIDDTLAIKAFENSLNKKY